jgi:hypothetical protein
VPKLKLFHCGAYNEPFRKHYYNLPDDDTHRVPKILGGDFVQYIFLNQAVSEKVSSRA